MLCSRIYKYAMRLPFPFTKLSFTTKMLSNVVDDSGSDPCVRIYALVVVADRVSLRLAWNRHARAANHDIMKAIEKVGRVATCRYQSVLIPLSTR
jgi:hypothetical protein